MTFPRNKAEKSPFQQHVVSYNPETHPGAWPRYQSAARQLSGTRCNATSACPISTVRTGSASCHRNRISRCSLTESASTNFDAHSPAPQSRKVDVSPTHFVHPQSWPPTTLNQTFSHRKAERSGSDQLFLSFNPKSHHKTNTFCPLTRK